MLLIGPKYNLRDIIYAPPTHIKICAKISAQEIEVAEGCRGRITDCLTWFQPLPSEKQLQANSLFKADVSDDSPSSYWDLTEKRVHSKDQQGCRQAAGCVSWVRGVMVLRRAIRRTTADKLLLHHSFLKWRQTDSKEIGSTGKCDYIPGFLYTSLQEACVFKDTYPWESMDVHIHIWVWVHYITTHLYKLYMCICLHIRSSYTPENPLLSFASRRGEKPWRTNGVAEQLEHSFISSSKHGLPESQMRGPLKPIKGFGQGSFKVSVSICPNRFGTGRWAKTAGTDFHLPRNQLGSTCMVLQVQHWHVSQDRDIPTKAL